MVAAACSGRRSRAAVAAPPQRRFAVLLMTAVVNLGLLIPAMPGNVGNYEALIAHRAAC